jgi:hypothetical protein
VTTVERVRFDIHADIDIITMDHIDERDDLVEVIDTHERITSTQ